MRACSVLLSNRTSLHRVVVSGASFSSASHPRSLPSSSSSSSSFSRSITSYAFASASSSPAHLNSSPSLATKTSPCVVEASAGGAVEAVVGVGAGVGAGSAVSNKNRRFRSRGRDFSSRSSGVSATTDTSSPSSSSSSSTNNSTGYAQISHKVNVEGVSRSSDKIMLQGLTFFGFHGTMVAEQQLGQKFTIDAELECDLRRAGITDGLSNTINYAKVYHHIREIVESERYNLLEALGERIASSILESFSVRAVRLRIKKPQVAVPGPVEFLGVELMRLKDDYDWLHRSNIPKSKPKSKPKATSSSSPSSSSSSSSPSSSSSSSSRS